jgi:hypothetical protein
MQNFFCCFPRIAQIGYAVVTMVDLPDPRNATTYRFSTAAFFKIVNDLFLKVCCFVLYIMGVVEVEEVEEAVFGNRGSHQSVFDHGD